MTNRPFRAAGSACDSSVSWLTEGVPGDKSTVSGSRFGLRFVSGGAGGAGGLLHTGGVGGAGWQGHTGGAAPAGPVGCCTPAVSAAPGGRVTRAGRRRRGRWNGRPARLNMIRARFLRIDRSGGLHYANGRPARLNMIRARFLRIDRSGGLHYANGRPARLTLAYTGSSPLARRPGRSPRLHGANGAHPSLYRIFAFSSAAWQIAEAPRRQWRPP